MCLSILSINSITSNAKNLEAGYLIDYWMDGAPSQKACLGDTRPDVDPHKVGSLTRSLMICGSGKDLDST